MVRPVREGMAVYLSGLLLITAAIELTLALFLATQGKVPSPSSDFWVVYLVVDVVLFAGGGVLVPRGLTQLRAGPTESAGEPPIPQYPLS